MYIYTNKCVYISGVEPFGSKLKRSAPRCICASTSCSTNCCRFAMPLVNEACHTCVRSSTSCHTKLAQPSAHTHTTLSHICTRKYSLKITQILSSRECQHTHGSTHMSAHNTLTLIQFFCIFAHAYTHIEKARTWWQRPIECLKLQVISHKKATEYRALL